MKFGGANSNNLRTVAVEKGWKDKVCKDCGSPLNLYNGRCDIHGQRSQFMFENPIRAFRQDVPAVKAALADLRLDLSVEGMKISEISPKVSMIVSKTETDPD